MDAFRIVICRVDRKKASDKTPRFSYLAVLPETEREASRRWFADNTLFGLQAQLKKAQIEVVDWEEAEKEIKVHGFYEVIK